MKKSTIILLLILFSVNLFADNEPRKLEYIQIDSVKFLTGNVQTDAYDSDTLSYYVLYSDSLVFYISPDQLTDSLNARLSSYMDSVQVMDSIYSNSGTPFKTPLSGAVQILNSTLDSLVSNANFVWIEAYDSAYIKNIGADKINVVFSNSSTIKSNYSGIAIIDTNATSNSGGSLIMGHDNNDLTNNARISVVNEDQTSGSEDNKVIVSTMVDGVLTDGAEFIGDSIYMPETETDTLTAHYVKDGVDIEASIFDKLQADSIIISGVDTIYRDGTTGNLIIDADTTEVNQLKLNGEMFEDYFTRENNTITVLTEIDSTIFDFVKGSILESNVLQSTGTLNLRNNSGNTFASLTTSATTFYQPLRHFPTTNSFYINYNPGVNTPFYSSAHDISGDGFHIPDDDTVVVLVDSDVKQMWTPDTTYTNNKAKFDSSVTINGVLKAKEYLCQMQAKDSTATIAATGVYYTFNKWVVDTCINVTSTDSSFTPSVDGFYYLYLNSSFSGINNATIESDIFIDDVLNDGSIGFSRKLSTGGDVGAASFSGLEYLTTSQQVKMKIKSDATGTATGDRANIGMFRIPSN